SKETIRGDLSLALSDARHDRTVMRSCRCARRTGDDLVGMPRPLSNPRLHRDATEYPGKKRPDYLPRSLGFLWPDEQRRRRGGCCPAFASGGRARAGAMVAPGRARLGTQRPGAITDIESRRR